MDQNMGFRFPRLGFDSLWVYNKMAIAVATAFFVHRWDHITILWESLRV